MPVRSREEAVAFIEDRESWPYWPSLPMKRIDQPREGFANHQLGWITADFPTIVLRYRPTTVGILVQLACEESPERLKELGVFDPTSKTTDAHRQAYQESVLARYDSVSDLLDAGWTID